MSQEAAFRYSRPGFSFTVYANRIDIEITAGNKKTETILLRNVNDVSVKGLAKKLYITTNDGKVREFVLGSDGEKARQAIVSNL